MTSTQKQVTSNLAHVYVRLYVRILHNLYVNMHPYENVERLDMLLVLGRQGVMHRKLEEFIGKDTRIVNNQVANSSEKFVGVC